MPDDFRRATEAEIATAHAWVDQLDWADDLADTPDLKTERQREYEHALEIIIFANGGRYAPPVDEAHLIEFRADGFTIQHPLSCRPNLFACPVNRVTHDLAEPPALGVFEARLNDAGDGLLIGDRVELP